MKSLAVRLTLVGLFVIAAGASAYLFWMGETRADSEAQTERAFDSQAIAVARSVLDLRAAQQAYVAAGQGDDFWAAKVTAAVASLKDALAGMRTAATSPQGQSEIDGALGSLRDFEQIDRRARDYTRSAQKLLASDLIFADGLEATTAAIAAVDRARDAERQAHDATTAAIRKRQLYAIGAAAAAALLAIILLAPRPADDPPVMLFQEPARVAPHTEAIDLEPSLDEDWSPPRKITAETPPPEAPVVAAATPAPSTAPLLDLDGVASLCTELARVADTRSLPALLERAASVLDASGIVLWIADPDGRELSPIITHGYAQQVVSRLGTIVRDAQNATAAAFRTSLLQTVKTDEVSEGAIAAPLVTPGGCVGVMAAEVRHEGEKDLAKLSIATIVAAQLATLVGPPSARTHAKAEASGM